MVNFNDRFLKTLKNEAEMFGMYYLISMRSCQSLLRLIQVVVTSRISLFELIVLFLFL